MVCLIGFFLMSLWSTGQNFGGEIIYPEKESIYSVLVFATSSILSSALMPGIQKLMLIKVSYIDGTQLIGIVFTLMVRYTNQSFGVSSLDFHLVLIPYQSCNCIAILYMGTCIDEKNRPSTRSRSLVKQVLTVRYSLYPNTDLLS